MAQSSASVLSPSAATRAATMAAAVIAGPRSVAIRSLPVPQPGPGQVRVRLEGCGVCASNLPVWQGRPYFQYPFAPGAPGHEAWGWIDAAGPEVIDFRLGERVALLSYHAYAEYDVASAGDVMRLPGELEGSPFPAEPLACAMNAFRRAQVSNGSTVAIVGIGFLGSLLTCLAARAGVFPLRELLTHSYPLDGLSRAMQDMEKRPAGFLKGWVRYD